MKKMEIPELDFVGIPGDDVIATSKGKGCDWHADECWNFCLIDDVDEDGCEAVCGSYTNMDCLDVESCTAVFDDRP